MATKLYYGEVGLTDEQAAPRLNSVKKIRKGVFRIINPVEFKAGETILLKTVPKILERTLQLESV